MNQQPPEDLLEESKQALNVAYAPYSHFVVGACLRSADGRLFKGANIENASYPLSLCAEACALAGMLGSGQHHWSEMVLISSGKRLCFPCGACRQRLFEFAQPDSVCHICTLAGEYQPVRIKDLLPYPFESANLETL